MNEGIVACKLPNGLLVDHKGSSVLLNGSDDPSAVKGYGMTSGVDLDWFNDWMTGDGKEFPPVTKGLIFVAGSESNAKAQATEQGDDIQSGLEGLDPDSPGPGVEPTDEQKAENAKVDKSKKPGK